MLANPGRHFQDLTDAIDTVHNYYERRVIETVFSTSERAREDREFLADVACVALNHLPPRYIRHDVDMTFFMSPQELAEMSDKITDAVVRAIDYVHSREQPAEMPTKTETTAAKNNKPAASRKTKTSKPRKKKSPGD